MPSLRSCSVGPPPSAIHGRGRLTRHPCRVAHCAEPPLGLSRGQEDQKQKPKPANRSACWPAFLFHGSEARSFVGASAAALERSIASGDLDRLSGRHREQARSHRGKSKAYTHALHHSSGRALARLQLLILIHPPPREAEWRCSSGEWRAAPFDAVEHIACRSQRSRPEGNAPG